MSRPPPPRPARPALSTQRVIDAAGRVADASGLAGVSMRSVARELDVEAMSLYHHVASKDALLDGLADWVFERIDMPSASSPWRSEMERRAHSARTVLAAHPWGLGLIESRRSPGPATLGHHDAVIGCLRGRDSPSHWPHTPSRCSTPTSTASSSPR